MGANSSVANQLVCKVMCDDPRDLPYRASAGASGYDLRAKLDGDITLSPQASHLVSAGVRLAIPKGFEAQIRSRSGLASKGVVVLNSPGTIDSDYRGVVMVQLFNHGQNNFTIKNGERIAQLVFARTFEAVFDVVASLDATQRNTKGHGSTGM